MDRLALGVCFQWGAEVPRCVTVAPPKWFAPLFNIRRASVSQVLVTLTIWTLPLVGGHHDIDLLLRVPVLRLRIDRTPPLRSVPKPFGSQFSVAGEAQSHTKGRW